MIIKPRRDLIIPRRDLILPRSRHCELTHHAMIIDGGGGSSLLPTTLDPAYCSTHITLSGGNLIATWNSSSVNGATVIATTSRSSGKFSFTAKRTTGTNLVHVGFFEASRGSIDEYIGRTNGWSWGSNGRIYAGGTQITGQPTFTTNDEIRLDFDWPNSIVKAYLNGAYAGISTTIGTNSVIWPAISPWGVSTAMSTNFGASAFSSPLLTGFRSWDNSQ